MFDGPVADEAALRALEGTGYQFVQTRGLMVLDSNMGLVACPPVGMAQVSSVVITAELGSPIRKGEELGYFQFGGSDFVMVFERRAHLALSCQPEQHFLQGAAVGRCRDGEPAARRGRASEPGAEIKGDPAPLRGGLSVAFGFQGQTPRQRRLGPADLKVRQRLADPFSAAASPAPPARRGRG